MRSFCWRSARLAYTIESLVSEMRIIIPTVFILHTNSSCHFLHHISRESHLFTRVCLFTKGFTYKMPSIQKKISTLQFERNETRICPHSTTYTASTITFSVFTLIANCNTWLKKSFDIYLETINIIMSMCGNIIIELIKLLRKDKLP